jgi:hypothetical protein
MWVVAGARQGEFTQMDTLGQFVYGFRLMSFGSSALVQIHPDFHRTCILYKLLGGFPSNDWQNIRLMYNVVH